MKELIIVSYPTGIPDIKPINIQIEFDSEIVKEYIMLEFENYILNKSSKNLIIHANYRIITGKFECVDFNIPENSRFLEDICDINKKIYYHKFQGVNYYYGIYNQGDINGIYSVEKNHVINWMKTPEKCFNIIIGVINYLISIILWKKHSILRVHASSFSYKGKIFLIFGHIKSGKSILTLSLCKLNKNLGYKYNSDDTTFIYERNLHFYVLPFLNPIKYTLNKPDDIKELIKQDSLYQYINSNGIKRYLSRISQLEIEMNRKSLELGGILIVNRQNINESSIEKINSIDNNSYNKIILDAILGNELLNINYLHLDNKNLKKKQIYNKIINKYPLFIFKFGNSLNDLKKINL